jgi:hypothetical protein
MSSWGNNDNAANAPYWAVNSAIAHQPDVNVKYARPTAANVALLYGNTTSDVYIAGETIGLFGIDAQEAAVAENPTGGKFAHAGWNLVTKGSGGRAGRVQTETLVALANMNGDGDGQTYANVSITLSGPSNGSVVSGSANANSVTFTVSPTLTGNTSATLSYQWQVNNNIGGSWVNMSNGNGPQPGGVQKSGVTTSTLTITPWNTTANNYVFRCIVTAADEGVSTTSANGLITIY